MSKQQALFEVDPPQWELDDAANVLVATVVFSTGLDQPLDYAVPDALCGKVEAGQRVRVPLGRGDRVVQGYCVQVENRREARRLKEVRAVVDPRPLLSRGMLKLTEWMAAHYLCPWGQVIETVLPRGVRTQAGTRETIFLSLPGELAPMLNSIKLPQKQLAVLKALAAAGHPLTVPQLCAAAQCTQAPINTLRAKGMLVAETRRVATAAPAARIAEREAHPAQALGVDHGGIAPGGLEVPGELDGHVTVDHRPHDLAGELEVGDGEAAGVGSALQA